MDEALILVVILIVVAVVVLAWLPGSIAKSRGHSKSDAIMICGFLSILLWPLWFVGIIWAFTENNRKAAPTQHVNRKLTNAMFADPNKP